MAKRKASSSCVVSEQTTDDGYISTYDADERQCWDDTAVARVVVVRDLRWYGKGLHIGQLGWTVPGTTDGYTAIDVDFDTGQRLSVRLPCGVCPVDRVVPEKADSISRALIHKYRNTRFDADCEVAEKCRTEWMLRNYGEYVSLAEMTESGDGDQELYAYTFPKLRELAGLKGEGYYPVKVGYSKESDAGAVGRVRQQITEAAAYPERPALLLVHRTWDGLDLEKQVQRELRELGRKMVQSLGAEWFLTSKEELIEILGRCSPAPNEPGRVMSGSGETLEERIGGLLTQGATVEFGIDAGSVRMTIRPPKEEREPR